MLAGVGAAHVIRNGQHADHGDVDREGTVQIKAVSVGRHSRAPGMPAAFPADFLIPWPRKIG